MSEKSPDKKDDVKGFLGDRAAELIEEDDNDKDSQDANSDETED